MCSAHNTKTAEILISIFNVKTLYPHFSPTEKLIIDNKAQTGGPSIFNLQFFFLERKHLVLLQIGLLQKCLFRLLCFPFQNGSDTQYFYLGHEGFKMSVAQLL